MPDLITRLNGLNNHFLELRFKANGTVYIHVVHNNAGLYEEKAIIQTNERELSNFAHMILKLTK